MGSEYTYYGTPGYGDGSMSPGAGGMYGGASPGYSPRYNPMGASPNPQYGQSPIYRGVQSPIYQTAGMSPAANPYQSPSYSPTNSRQSPSYGTVMTPAYTN